jgi:hypothetical protein
MTTNYSYYCYIGLNPDITVYLRVKNTEPDLAYYKDDSSGAFVSANERFKNYTVVKRSNSYYLQVGACLVHELFLIGAKAFYANLL